MNGSMVQSSREEKEAKVFAVRSRACYLLLQRRQKENNKKSFKSSIVNLGIDEFENLTVHKYNMPKTTCAIRTLAKSVKVTSRKLIWSQEIKSNKKGYCGRVRRMVDGRGSIVY